jgi:hypothetical protein
VYNGIAIEDFGKPVVLLAHYGFVPDAQSAASSHGMPGIRVVSTSIAPESTVAAEIEAGIAAAMPEIVGALTRPLTAEEANPVTPSGKQPRVAFKGSYDEINLHFYTRGWTDGLPVVPPTEKAVAEMLTGTDLPPDHLVAEIIPRKGKATVEKIAINAVMAGALPTHMPILIAAVEAVMDPASRYDTFQVSTGSWAPFLAINGPVRRDIHIASGSGALSPGTIANAAIGRAMGLISQNIGGARKAIEDMGVLGNPGKYSLVLAEDEERSSWEPLHVELGFKPEDNTLTLFLPNTYIQTVARETDAAGILDTMATMAPGTMASFVLIPSHTKILSDAGWTKKKVKEYIIDNAPPPFPPMEGFESATAERTAMEDLMIIVAGGPGAWIGLHRSVGGWGNSFVTKKINLPRNWDKLVEKYGNVVPAYERY